MAGRVSELLDSFIRKQTMQSGSYWLLMLPISGTRRAGAELDGHHAE